ncbi:MAG: hypothetical protein U5O69_10335 [Candidatus Competibacteraceae bacterium]|nr:hypothetical protein [Candidatus Competibacteraceae bacterium]
MRPISENVQRKTSAALWAWSAWVTLALCLPASPAQTGVAEHRQARFGQRRGDQQSCWYQLR